MNYQRFHIGSNILAEGVGCMAISIVCLLTLPIWRLYANFKNFTEAAALGCRSKTMAKPATIKIRLNSTAGTGHFYVTKKNARTMTDKIVVRKYDPVKREHVEYKEGKIK